MKRNPIDEYFDQRIDELQYNLKLTYINKLRTILSEYEQNDKKIECILIPKNALEDNIETDYKVIKVGTIDNIPIYCDVAKQDDNSILIARQS